MSITVVDSLFNALDMCSTQPNADNMYPNARWKDAELTPETEANLNHIRDAFKSTTVEIV